MTPFPSPLHIYIYNKPVKWGFKLWCLCDTLNGYTSSFSVYRGKNGEVGAEMA